MAFPSYDDVAAAAAAILAARITPTVRTVAEHLGGTKNHTIIAKHLRTWQRETLQRLTEMQGDLEPLIEDESRDISLSEGVIRLQDHPPCVAVVLKGIHGHVDLTQMQRIAAGIKDDVTAALFRAPPEFGGGIVLTLTFYQSIKTRLTTAQAEFLAHRAAVIIKREQQRS